MPISMRAIVAQYGVGAPRPTGAGQTHMRPQHIDPTIQSFVKPFDGITVRNHE
jgi:hypothetical protein